MCTELSLKEKDANPCCTTHYLTQHSKGCKPAAYAFDFNGFDQHDRCRGSPHGVRDADEGSLQVQIFFSVHLKRFQLEKRNHQPNCCQQEKTAVLLRPIFFEHERAVRSLSFRASDPTNPERDDFFLKEHAERQALLRFIHITLFLSKSK